MRYYRLTCGCKYGKEKLWKNPKSKSFRCPIHHDARIDTMVQVCLDCGERLILNYRQAKRERCEKCQKTRSHKIIKEAGKISYRKKKQNLEIEEVKSLTEHQKAAQDRSDCKHWEECLFALKPQDRCRQCLGCERYVSWLTA